MFNVFEFSPKSVSPQHGTTVARLGKFHSHSAHIFLSIFKICFRNLRYMEPDFQILHIPDPSKCVLGPGDAWACAKTYRIILKSGSVGQTISDPGQNLIVYTCRQYGSIPFSKML